MAKILQYTDIHIHNHKQSLQRLQDCLNTLRWVFQTARELKVEKVLFLGDLFHDRQKIQVIAYHNTFEIFNEYRDVETEILLGNHDLWFYDKWDVSSVMPLSALPNVNVISRPCTKNIAGLAIDFIPFTHDPISIISNHFKTKSRVMCGHLAVDDAVLNSIHNTRSEASVENEKDVIKVSKDVFNGWERVFLGHYHCAQRLGHVEYIGSPLQLSFNEAGQTKHVVVMDTDTLECEYIENTFSPKHLILKQSELSSYDLNNNFVQVQVEDVDSSEIIDMRKAILDNNNVQSLEFKELKLKDVRESHDELQVKFDIANGDVLDRYMVAVGFIGFEHDKLLQIGKDICNEN